MDPFDLHAWSHFKQAGGKQSSSSVIDQIAIDSRRIDSPHALFVALEGTRVDGHQFVAEAARAGARFALVKKHYGASDLPPDFQLLRVESPLHAFQEIVSCYRRQLSTRVIAITGAQGKTMTKDLLHAMICKRLRVAASPESFNSQIGVPLSLLTVNKSHEIALIEAAISEPGEMDALVSLLQPDCCLLTHLSNSALPSLGTVSKTADELLKLLCYPKRGWVLLPEHPLLLQTFEAKRYFWNRPSTALPHASLCSQEKEEKVPYCIAFPDESIHKGVMQKHFRYFLDLLNITTKAAWLLGVPSSEIAETIQGYTPELMRTEIWKAPTGVTLINDIYCQDPQSVDCALNYFQQMDGKSRKFFIFGGLRKNSQNPTTDYRRIGKALSQENLDHVALVGEHPFETLCTVLEKSAPHTCVRHFSRYQSAFDAVASEVKHGDVVLVKGEKKHSLDRVTKAFHKSEVTNQCLINLSAVQYNLEALRKKLPKKTRLMVMVKALAYGTDDVRVAHYLKTCGVDIIGVSNVEEGVHLRRAGVTSAIFVIHAALHEMATLVQHQLEVGVSDQRQIEALEAHEAALNVHLHIDTGMGRFGCRPEEALALAQQIVNRKNLQLEGVMTHFACAENPEEDTFTRMQIARFDAALQEIKGAGIAIPWIHAANSAAAIRFDLPQCTMVRLGVAVYGLHPSDATKEQIQLRPALSLQSRIVGINTCKEGESVSYGRQFKVTREEQKIACLPIGYYDGLHLNYSGKGHVLIRGKPAPYVGKICMDYMMVDVTDIPHVEVGDPALIFGEDAHGNYLSPEEVASWGNTITHELITCLGPRIQRIFVI